MVKDQGDAEQVIELMFYLMRIQDGGMVGGWLSKIAQPGFSWEWYSSRK